MFNVVKSLVSEIVNVYFEKTQFTYYCRQKYLYKDFGVLLTSVL